MTATCDRRLGRPCGPNVAPGGPKSKRREEATGSSTPRIPRGARKLQEALARPKKRLEALGGPSRAQENPEGPREPHPRKPQEAPGGRGRPQEAQRYFKNHEAAPGSPRSPPGTPRSPQEAPGGYAVMLQCASIHNCILQIYWAMLQYAAICCALLRYAICCNMLQYAALCCKNLQYAAPCGQWSNILQYLGVCCNMRR